MRGKAFHFGPFAVAVGITLARAGKRACPRRTRSSGRDHPRACGEKSSTCPAQMSVRGSSPRMRGKGLADQPAVGDRGITPARAGKRFVMPSVSVCSRDHPRACGENTDLKADAGANQRSPPRMRGKVLAAGEQRAHGGITPARAGKSYQDYNQWAGCRDHPRACGEKL